MGAGPGKQQGWMIDGMAPISARSRLIIGGVFIVKRERATNENKNLGKILFVVLTLNNKEWCSVYTGTHEHRLTVRPAWHEELHAEENSAVLQGTESRVLQSP